MTGMKNPVYYMPALGIEPTTSRTLSFIASKATSLIHSVTEAVSGSKSAHAWGPSDQTCDPRSKQKQPVENYLHLAYAGS